MPELREALEEAFDAEVEETKPSTEVEKIPVEPEPEKEVPSEPAPSEEEEAPVDAPEDKAPEAKFLPPEGEEGQIEEAPAIPDVSERAPSSWRGEAKQHWGELPSEVRQEVMRRERHVNDVLRDSADARHFQDTFEEVVRPYASFIAADGQNPLQATQNLMQAAATLRAGTADQKVAMAYDIIKRYGVDIQMLDSMLAGETPVPGGGLPGQPGAVAPGDPLLQYIDQRLAPVTEFVDDLRDFRTNRQRALEAEVDTEVDTFAADPNNVFFEDVREDMAVILETAANQGRNMTISQAYDVALNMNPELAKIQSQRRVAQNALDRQKTLAQKKAAAASVQGTSVSPAPSVADDMRSQINAAWDLNSGGS